MRFDCAQMENAFLRKRLQQCEERLDSELASRKELEQQVRGKNSLCCNEREHELRRSAFEFHFCSGLVGITSHFEPQLSLQ